MKKFKKVSDADRFSILQPVMDRCFYCSYPGGDIHEIYGGAYRERSKAEGMCVRLCRYHHDTVHEHGGLDKDLKRRGQAAYEKTHTREEFIEAFGHSYLED